MREFIWIEWNLAKIEAHCLSREEVEFAWHRRRDLRKRIDDHGVTIESAGQCPSGRWIKILWRYNVDRDGETKVFVITAHNL